MNNRGENNKNAFLNDFQELLKKYNISEIYTKGNGGAVFVSNGIPFEVVMYKNGRFLLRNEHGKFIIQHD